jgi:two-component system sensor histidine kinase YesM
LTLRRKVILAFCMITIPLVSFLLYTNYYSRQVVREQVSGYNASLLTLYGNQIDETLDNGNSYLYRLANQEPDIRSLIYNLNNPDEYALSKVAVSSRLFSDFQYNKSLYLDFVYIPKNRDLITAQPGQQSYWESEYIVEYLKDLFEEKGTGERIESFQSLWRNCRIANVQYLLRIVETDTNTYVGSLIRLDDLMTPLKLIARDRSVHAYFLDSDGEWLLPGPPLDTAAEGSVAVRNNLQAYQTTHGAEKYLMVDHPVRLSNLVLAVMIPEKVMLQQVPLFQRIGYVIPFASGLMLLIFLVYLQKLLIVPVQRLIKGMRQLSKGNFENRLIVEGAAEIIMIGETFNNMVSEIQGLKIQVYEDELRLQKAELKMLQLQINPHFLFNSLNIIYNLAETGKVQLIQQMTRHMVGYLRFFARLKEHLITVSEEMDIIDHYMNIQKLRFPKNLVYEGHIDVGVAGTLIPPLTIQPFVENALKHGFSRGIFKVSVSARTLDKSGRIFCELIIEDNGKGFPSHLTEELLETLTDPAFTKMHIGIWNVYTQLKTLYQGEATLRLSNIEPSGARVTIVIPILTGMPEGVDA